MIGNMDINAHIDTTHKCKPSVDISKHVYIYFRVMHISFDTYCPSISQISVVNI